MRAKNSKPITRAEAEHLRKVKELPCVSCGAPFSEAHHVRQGLHFTTVAWCTDCHRGPNGWHGNKSMQRIRHADELDDLNETLRGIYGQPKT